MKTEAKKRANNKYDLAHYSVLGCKLRKEDAEAFKQACKDRNTSPNAIFKEAITKFMASNDSKLKEPELEPEYKFEEDKYY